MKNNEIYDLLLNEGTFESKMKLAEVVGYDRLKDILTEIKLSGTKVPHFFLDILGTLAVNEEKKLAEILENSTSEQVEVLVKAFGPEKCERASKLIKNPSKAHLVVDYTTPMKYQESSAFVATIEETALTDYKLAQEMVRLHGIKKTKEDIKATESIRPIKHIVADVLGPLKATNDESGK